MDGLQQIKKQTNQTEVDFQNSDSLSDLEDSSKSHNISDSLSDSSGSEPSISDKKDDKDAKD